MDKVSTHGMDIAWNELSCTVALPSGGTTQILKGVSGYARAGKVTAIMGPSGAGKTTMMDIISGRLRTASAKTMTISGDVLVNEKPINFATFRKKSAYVEQQDFLPATETVRECLMFSAQLRLPRDVSDAQRRDRVEAVIEELGLTTCANTFIGSAAAGIKGVSGGEKRRTSVGMELVTSPAVLFLDEPTSGLDSEIAVTIMRTLQDVAGRGRTVALTIHQPNSDITDLFDDFVLLAKGSVMYAGPWQDAVGAFAACGYQCPQYKNPSDYFMKVVSDTGSHGALVDAQSSRWASTRRMAFASFRSGVRGPAGNNGRGTEIHKEGDAPLEEVKVDGAARLTQDDLVDHEKVAVSPFKQISILCGRNLRAWKRHPIMLMGEAVQYIFLALFVGGMYFDVSDGAEQGTFERGAATFFIIVTVAFTPPFTTATTWQEDRKLVRKDVGQHIYSLDVFFWARTLIMLPVEACFTLLVSMITYLMYDFRSGAGPFFIYTLGLYLTLIIAESIGLICAMGTGTAEIAVVLMSIQFIILLALTGFLTTETPVYYEWVEHINFLRYANSAMFQNEMYSISLTATNGSQVSGRELADANNITNDLTVWGNIGVLFGIFVLCRLSALLGLKLAWRRGWL